MMSGHVRKSLLLAAAVIFRATPGMTQIVLPPGQTTYDVPSGTQNLTQQVTGAGGIDKTGAGTLQFSYTGAPPTNYSGPTNILAGAITGNGAGSLSANSAYNISSGASLNLVGANSIGSLSGAGKVNLDGGRLSASSRWAAITAARPFQVACSVLSRPATLPSCVLSRLEQES